VAPPFRAVFSCRKQRSDTGQKPGATKNYQGQCGPYKNQDAPQAGPLNIFVATREKNHFDPLHRRRVSCC